MPPDSPLDGYRFGRPRGPEDWKAIREICCGTAESGQGIPEERRPFFAEYWVAPYERLVPDWTWVAWREQEVVGYLSGCPATASFVLRRHFLVRWPLFFRAVSGAFPSSPDAAAFVKRFLFIRKDLGRRLALKFLAGILTLYPAHLHVNVDPAHHGKGIGKRLMEIYMMGLRQHRVPGVHLVCGEGSLAFYRKLGFQELAGTDVGPGVKLHAMGLILA
ncbi:MAG: GNAT family N-acetyltransferase [Elusimicrobia bacterium]|nr:GNAT family N-acetyltransferase [Elusimicrobiota bacterium]